MAAVLVAVGGTAFAYFRSSGAGSGAATTGSSLTVTVAAATPSNDLFPGRSGTVKFTLTNNNHFTANFSSVTAATAASGAPSSCAASNIQIATLPYSVPTISVAPGQTTGTQTINGLISMSSSAPSTCQGVGFTISLTLSGNSN